MDQASRDLILASEISALLHDLGKLRREFAQETCQGEITWDYEACKAATGINSMHGAILEPPEARAYPPAQENADSWLSALKSHPGWAEALRIPSTWLRADTTDQIQAHGLGDPLREHHSGKNFIGLTLLGTLFALGADIRDSAVDKSGKAKGSGQQHLGQAYIADAFGNEWPERAYEVSRLDSAWSQAAAAIQEMLLAADAWEHLPETRTSFLAAIRPIFEQALGATLRPTNDVTLWHHGYATASLHKAQIAEGALRQDFSRWQDENGLADQKRFGLIRYRLLGIRWDWAGLARTVLEPGVFAALAQRRKLAADALRQRIEVDNPIGNCIYQDDDGLIFVVPGFFEEEDSDNHERSERLFAEHILNPLEAGILHDLTPLGSGVEVRLAWTQPRLYLTDFRDLMPARPQGGRERLLQVDEAGLRRLWSTPADRPLAICPSCGLRPGVPAERGLRQATLKSWRAGYCQTCAELSASGTQPAPRFQHAAELLGFRPRTFELHRLRQRQGATDNPRLALISVQIDPLGIAEGRLLATQVARPWDDLPVHRLPGQSSDLGGLGAFFQGVHAHLESGRKFKKPHHQDPEIARNLIGDTRWIDSNDGRIPAGDSRRRGLALIHEFFLREWVPPELIRDDHPIGDPLALFALRKHASPGRLARLWSDFDGVWRAMLGDIAALTDAHAVPLSLDVRGFRLIVAAADARAVLRAIRARTQAHFQRVQGRLPLDISVAVFREKFPLYLALDATRRMEERAGALAPEVWTLATEPRRDADHLHLTWHTDRGHQPSWRVPLTTADPEREDLWYNSLICLSRPPGPGRLVRMSALEPGDQVQIRPMTFDYSVLEGSSRRYQIRYDQRGYRPHFILGEPGRRPFLLEQLDDLFELAGATGWTASQSKAILGETVDTYERWVRDVPAALRPQGLAAWHRHVERWLMKALPDKAHAETRAALLAGLDQGLFFDTFDWNEFVEKGATQAATARLATATGA